MMMMAKVIGVSLCVVAALILLKGWWHLLKICFKPGYGAIEEDKDKQ